MKVSCMCRVPPRSPAAHLTLLPVLQGGINCIAHIVCECNFFCDVVVRLNTFLDLWQGTFPVAANHEDAAQWSRSATGRTTSSHLMCPPEAGAPGSHQFSLCLAFQF